MSDDQQNDTTATTATSSSPNESASAPAPEPAASSEPAAEPVYDTSGRNLNSWAEKGQGGPAVHTAVVQPEHTAVVQPTETKEG